MNQLPTLPEFPDEVVTEAHVRFTEPKGLGGKAALITLDNGFDHNRPNSYGPAGIQKLWDALDEIDAEEDVKLIAVTGKPFIFLAGADISAMPHLETHEQAKAMGQAGHALYRRLKDSSIPTFAFVNGVTLGGGMELALHCHYRTIVPTAAAIGLPEVAIGLIPGWGGTQLLPNLIGPEKAAQVVLRNPLNQNKMLKGHDAYKLGIADAEFEAADFLERSLEWAVDVVNGETTVERPEIDTNSWDGVMAAVEAEVDERTHGASPAAKRAVELLRLAKDAEFDAGCEAEDVALADSMVSPECKSSLYAFDLTRKLAKKPAGAPKKTLAKDVNKVGVIGAGLMASQLALLFARRLEVPVVMTDLDADRAQKGVDYVNGEIDKLESKGRIDKVKAGKLRGLVSGTDDKSVYGDCDLVIEAVFEEMSVKKSVFAEVEPLLHDEALLVTNTSGLSISEMGSDLNKPERLVGMHFFNPVAVMPLLEIIPTEKTAEETLATAFVVGKKLKKTCVKSADRPAFIVNRLLGRMLGEVARAVDEGTPVEVANQATDPMGLPMRPFELLGLVGAAVAEHLVTHLHEDLGDRFPLSENQKRMAESKEPVFEKGSNGKFALTEHGKSLLQQGDAALTADELHERIVNGLAEEAGLMLQEGVVEGPEQIDLAMIMGAGFPFWLGGLTPYLDRIGAAEKANGKKFAAGLK
ncbi:3-hydroxyacyl-CoA dehydrogenase NAD-binding domain-containing protein [Haloglycomyces albus]|uniref:3-hydroxyacyl-CoA dehydrogenase NAD-binding domain-containing protein n=1 Tax=Haloglycomyces albus TaxID=526067 RepID=UPI0004A30CCC|nr:3-hydroxyacyl-CoA dehydrogenase NAD-binding domain-containing protein [Haloglycomyces albus]